MSADEDDPQEVAGDPYAELEGHGCLDPMGHLFLTKCGETKCVHCGWVAWT